MTLREIVKKVLTKAKEIEGNKQVENLIIGAINKAYIEIAAKCPIVSECDYYALSKVINLPDDYLVNISLSHSSLGYLQYPFMYSIVGQSLILSNDVINSGGSLHLIYGILPTLLANDNDVPLIPVVYHNALYTYALYVVTSELAPTGMNAWRLPSLMTEYGNVISSIPPIVPAKDDVNYIHQIIDSTGW